MPPIPDPKNRFKKKKKKKSWLPEILAICSWKTPKWFWEPGNEWPRNVLPSWESCAQLSLRSDTSLHDTYGWCSVIHCPFSAAKQTLGGQCLQAWQNDFAQLREDLRRFQLLFHCPICSCVRTQWRFMRLSWPVATPYLKAKSPCVLFVKDFTFVTLS